MTEPIAMTIRHMKIEDYPLVYELWIRCTGFTMRDIDDCKDAIKTFLERNPNTCFVPRTMAEESLARFLPATTEDGRASTTRQSTPTRAVEALARFWWAAWLKRFVRSACRKSLSEYLQTTMPATISGNVKALQSVMIWFIENCRCNNEPSTMPRPNAFIAWRNSHASRGPPRWKSERPSMVNRYSDGRHGLCERAMPWLASYV